MSCAGHVTVMKSLETAPVACAEDVERSTTVAELGGGGAGGGAGGAGGGRGGGGGCGAREAEELETAAAHDVFPRAFVEIVRL